MLRVRAGYLPSNAQCRRRSLRKGSCSLLLNEPTRYVRLARPPRATPSVQSPTRGFATADRLRCVPSRSSKFTPARWSVICATTTSSAPSAIGPCTISLGASRTLAIAASRRAPRLRIRPPRAKFAPWTCWSSRTTVYGVQLLGDYEQAYGQFFSMFCDILAEPPGWRAVPARKPAAGGAQRRSASCGGGSSTGDSRRERRAEPQPFRPPEECARRSTPHPLVRLPRA